MAEFWSNNDRGYRIRLWVDQVGQDIQNNTSQVRLRLALLNTTTTFAQYQCSAYVEFNGQRLNWSGSPSVLSWYQTVELIDQTITVRHADDGSGVFSVRAHFNGSGGWSPVNLDIGNQQITLTTIPRGSSVRVSDGFIGNQVDISIDKKVGSATHTLRYSWYNKQGKIADNVGTSYKWTIPEDFANDIPNSTSGRGTIYVDTYINGNFIQTQSTTFTASVITNNMKPSLTGFTLTDANPVSQRVIPESTHFVSIMSLVKVTFNGAQAKSGATIAGYYAEIVGANNSVTENGGVLREVSVNKDTEMTLRGRVLDSRGIWSDWVETKLMFLFYFSPALRFEVKRSDKKLDILTIKRFAKIAPLTVNGVQKNTMKLTFTTRKFGSDTEVLDNGQAGGSWSQVSEFNASDANLGNRYPADTSYIVTGKLEDEFTSASFQVTVPTDEVIMTYDRQGVGIGKYRERGALDVAGDIYANNSQIQQYQLTSNNGAPKWDVDNANNLYEPGQYILGPSAPGNPNGQWGFLFHYSYNGKNTDGIKEAIQTFWSNNGQMFFRHHRWSMIIDDWEPWIDYTPKKPSVVKREIQIGWGVRANLVRESNVVTLSLERGIYSLPPCEYINLDEKIPNGFKPCVQVHMVANKNASDVHYGCAVWHLETNGDIRFSNPHTDTFDGNAVYTGTVTYITEDEYPQ
ncbi:minor tail protein [Streptococcus phage CHPC1045]|uniref:Capsid and scaffold protein n=1 Tax=Streptococcus phage CHPC1045 TaxID=2365017 RepID=A0A3G8FCW2_9CAUD|nr:minor tail protein [Streptococcus phage CHPC1045]AZF92628.1 capsid and scaffold protein [Streptococcus phage CHPC1045]